MKLDTTTLKLPEDCYFQEKLAKNMIVLHFTAGSTAKGAANYWSVSKNKVSAPYLLDTDGTIYQTYDPAMWSYHLGFKGTWAHDKRSVAIEIVNIGPLVRKGDALYCWVNNFGKKYCDISETDKYVDLGGTEYRGYSYFASFTKPQMDVLPELVSSITDQFKIQKKLPPKESRGAFDIEAFKGWQGIWDHAACRKDKLDVGPAFDWSLLENL